MQFTTRAYNSIKLSEDKQTLTKYSNTERFYDEINYYKHIPANVAKYFPKIIESDTSSTPYSLSMSYYASGVDLGKLMCTSNLDTVKWRKIRKSIHDILTDMHNNVLPDRVISDKPYRDMYITKTNTEYTKLLENPVFAEMTSYSELKINGKIYKNYAIISDKVESLISQLLFKKIQYTMIHGDMCFGNILYLGEHMVLVDPRGSWGFKGIYGDPRYDMAKLYHSFEGCYEYIVNDLFALEVNGNSVSFNYTNDNHKQIFDIFREYVFDDREYRLIEGLIYIGMCARHYDSIQRQIIMYCTGVKILNEVLEL